MKNSYRHNRKAEAKKEQDYLQKAQESQSKLAAKHGAPKGANTGYHRSRAIRKVG